MWPAGPISQAFAAIAIMQLYEANQLGLEDTVGQYMANLPETWQNITILQLLRHATGLPDYRHQETWHAFQDWTFTGLVDLVSSLPLHFDPGTDVEQSATNCLLLTEIVEQVSGQSYHDFVFTRQIADLGLRHTGFSEDLHKFPQEDVSLSQRLHKLFKENRLYIDCLLYTSRCV